MSRLSGVVKRLVHAVPEGVELSRADWDRRHRWIVSLLWFHVPGILAFGLVRGVGLLHALVETLPVAVAALTASSPSVATRARAAIAGLGLMLSSAVLVHLSGGTIELHFHFFVMLGVISLYQDWRPFLLAIGFVVVHHGVIGSLAPADVFDHGAAWRRPLLWAGIHALFVLGACVVSTVSWRIVEDAHRRSKADLQDSERRFRALIEHSSDVVTVFDVDGVIRYDSPSCERLFGYDSGERIGTDAFDLVHPDDVPRSREILAGVIATGRTAEHVEARLRHRDGSWRWVEATVTNLVNEPAVRGLVANFRDTTDRKLLEEQLSRQAFHDPLTGLANRALLLDRLAHAGEAAERRSGTCFALLFLDLDDFKTVNDGLGHDAGDELLRVTADRIAGTLRKGDTAARLGGDEFAILLEELPSAAAAHELGAQILDAVREPFELEGTLLSTTASVGIAVGSNANDAGALLRNADLAMYRAKAEGKGCFAIYEDGMHAAVVERMALRADLRRGAEADEFEPHYQPIVELSSGRVVGIEALARWRHPERGLVPPAAFIPLAEETGLILTIGRQLLRQACRDLATWTRELGATAPRSVSVNLSPRQLQDAGLVEEVASALRDAGLPGRALTLEITETALLEDTEVAARTLTALKALGVCVALDDFGTGYSSLSHLARFPVDVVKIDKSFVDTLAGADATGSPLVAAIVHLGSLLGLGVTAEGIEAQDQLDRLEGIGCRHGQGYYFAKPMPAADVAAAVTALREGGQAVPAELAVSKP